MNTSSYFDDLRALYQAELDDLRTDSEGNHVLARRLAEKRSELGFLLQMMDINPEMLAVVLHNAFRFANPAVMDLLVQQDVHDLPGWDSINTTIDIAAWAGETVQTILREPTGKAFMVLAAALEYLLHKPQGEAESTKADNDEDGQQDRDEMRHERHDDHRTEDDDDDEAAARAREEAGNDWLTQQGFDQKDAQ
ncbi:MAG: hypothetical protein IPG42_22625 [Betaproteobacteria bacterium]|nr:hypothetical protein [Betaproteobacteria bacterium]MBP6644355.1 hypothetical protein [Burkholderiaceae bacterium]